MAPSGGLSPTTAYHRGARRAAADGRRVCRHRDRARQLRKINQHCLARIARRWSNFPEVNARLDPSAAAAATDLDLFGHASLFHMMCLASTPQGVDVLRDWLLEPAEPDEICARQEAAQELAGEVELEALYDLLDETVVLLGIAHVSNALGTVNPVRDIVARAHELGIAVLVDGAQGVPHLSVDDPMAAAMKYTEDAASVDPATRNNPAADQTCANCALVQGNDGDAWRPCQIFPGKLVAAKGGIRAGAGIDHGRGAHGPQPSASGGLEPVRKRHALRRG